MSVPVPVIVAARRTPIGRVGGVLRSLSVEKLAAPVLNAVVSDVGIDPAEVDDVILGNAAGPGGNPARVSLLEAGWPVNVPGVTVDRQCGSGLEAVIQAAQQVRAGAVRIVVAGGVESCSTAPLRAHPPAADGGDPLPYFRARFAPDTVGDPDMGEAAENVARACGISRVRQDAFALESHRRAVAANDDGRFDHEIVAVAGMNADECPRRDTSADKLAALPPVFTEDGTVTAGNACPLNDGAAAVVVMDEDLARTRGLGGGLRVLGGTAAGVDPNLLGLGPVPAVEKLIAATGLKVADFTRIEFNEAFAAQVLACADKLRLSHECMNVAGGAIALGHPFGASGTVLVVRLFTELLRQGTGGCGLATLGIGGGLGLAMAVEAAQF